MQEWCTCNASFRTRSYKRLIEWRNSHRHEVTPDPEPEPQGTQALVERSFQDDELNLRIGFVPNFE